MTTATTSRANPNARERRRDVPGFLDDPEDVVPAGAEHRGASREWLRERTRQALQLCRAVPRRSSRRRGRKVRSAWSTSRAQAVAWEKEAMVAVRHGRLRASTPTTVRQAGIALITGMLSG